MLGDDEEGWERCLGVNGDPRSVQEGGLLIHFLRVLILLLHKDTYDASCRGSDTHFVQRGTTIGKKGDFKRML